MPSRLIDIAEALGGLYAQRKDLQIQLAHQDTDYASRVLALTPEGGWPGKNEEQRDLMRKRAEADDEPLANIRAQLSQLNERLAECEGDIEALEAERRALEWSIRDRLAASLSGRRNGHDAPAETDFDDAADESAVETELDGLPF